jgi:hypothetical protein
MARQRFGKAAEDARPAFEKEDARPWSDL